MIPYPDVEKGRRDMLVIHHRINSVQALRRVPPECGVELDVRDYDGDLRLTHEPFTTGERLEDYLAEYRHALAVFNVKCDGLEPRIAELAARFGVREYFFLDSAPATLVSRALRGERHAAARFSELEPIEAALALAGKVDWVWVDCFTCLPLEPATVQSLHAHFAICLVSPELQRHPRAWISEFRARLRGLPIDAVCTDFPGDWSPGEG